MTTLLCILDGLGINPDSRGNAFALASTPHLSALLSTPGWTTLHTHGERVGLPAGQMGNSEVGHLNIGAGRIVEQWLLRVARGFERGLSLHSDAYATFIQNHRTSRRIHLIGLVSDGGVHSHMEHGALLVKDLLSQTEASIVLHLITDGRDTAPRAARGQIESFLSPLQSERRVSVGSILGRYYGMDRDTRWDRTLDAVAAIGGKSPRRARDPITVIEDAYLQNTSDEFILPTTIDGSIVKEGDGVVFFNFRADRMRQLVRALCLSDCAPRSEAPLFSPTHAICMANYDVTFPLPFIFEASSITQHLGDVVAAAGKRQLRVAETEKYPHVTYFFNGGREEPCQGEERMLLPSPRDVATYDEKPQMAAREVCDAVIQAIQGDSFDLIVVNFANCDMVGHTGVLSAGVKAVETVDTCVGRIIEALGAANGNGLIIADHGNAEQMIHYDKGTPHTAHTLYPVPAILLGTKGKAALRAGGSLSDVAPTLLELMNIPQPVEMTGRSLIFRQP